MCFAPLGRPHKNSGKRIIKNFYWLWFLARILKTSSEMLSCMMHAELWMNHNASNIMHNASCIMEDNFPDQTFMIHDIWYTIFDIQYTICNMWYVIFHIWFMTMEKMYLTLYIYTMHRKDNSDSSIVYHTSCILHHAKWRRPHYASWIMNSISRIMHHGSCISIQYVLNYILCIRFSIQNKFGSNFGSL